MLDKTGVPFPLQLLDEAYDSYEQYDSFAMNDGIDFSASEQRHLVLEVVPSARGHAVRLKWSASGQ